VELGKNNSGRGVGGSMIHYAGYCPRFHPSDFATHTIDGVGADWPLGYQDLRPHYEQVERELPPDALAHRVEIRAGCFATRVEIDQSTGSATGVAYLREGEQVEQMVPAHVSIQTVSPLPIGWAEHVLAEARWGGALREYVRDYNHWAVVGVLNELLPQADNRVTLADETDQRGVPISRFDPTQGSANPALTIMALASRLADHLGAKR
jgi:choline dehydrogenase-like flavoprotein